MGYGALGGAVVFIYFLRISNDEILQVRGDLSLRTLYYGSIKIVANELFLAIDEGLVYVATDTRSSGLCISLGLHLSLILCHVIDVLGHAIRHQPLIIHHLLPNLHRRFERVP